MMGNLDGSLWNELAINIAATPNTEEPQKLSDIFYHCSSYQMKSNLINLLVTGVLFTVSRSSALRVGTVPTSLPASNHH